MQRPIKKVNNLRKIIQISTCSVKIGDDEIEQSIIALCEDGSLWDGSWDMVEGQEHFAWEKLPGIKV